METSHRETVEAMTAELAKSKRSHGDMLALSRDQVRLLSPFQPITAPIC